VTHPSGASYKYKPAWLNRAEGGDVPLPTPDPREGASETRGAYRDLRTTPPVTVMEDLVGRVSPGLGQQNALRDAIRGKAVDTIKKYGLK
jgi:hypothetical protein